MGENSILRRAEQGDAFELAKLQLKCWRETYSDLLSESFFEQQSIDDRLAMWSGLLAGPHAGRHWVAVDVGRLVGFAGSIPPIPGRSTQAELWGLYFLAAYHGSGLGQKLLDATIGAEAAMLWIAEDNPRAQAFYKRNGFTLNGVTEVIETEKDSSRSRWCADSRRRRPLSSSRLTPLHDAHRQIPSENQPNLDRR